MKALTIRTTNAINSLLTSNTTELNIKLHTKIILNKQNTVDILKITCLKLL